MIDAVLFDLDGTLIDTTSAILASLQHTEWYFTGEKREPEGYKQFLGMTLEDVMQAIVPNDADAARDVYIKHNLGIHQQMVKPFDGVPETLKALKAKGIKIAIVTSKRRSSAEVGLRVTGLAGMFDAEVYYDDTEHHKPEAEPLLRALELLGVSSGRIVMVGDSVWDIRAAKNAQLALENVEVKSVGAAYGPSGRDVLLREHPDYLIDSVPELLGIC